MKTENHSQEKIQTQDRVFISPRVLEMYIDLVLRGLVSFVVFGLCGYLLLIQVFNMSFVYALPIIFLVSILSSPLLSKIKFGHKVQNRYDNFLRKIIYRMNNYEKRNRR